jgi:shikimate kinase
MNKKGDHIIFIGMSGAGKTTLGEALSASMNLPFIDTDQEIEKKTGSSIIDIFREDGESKFRSYESGILNQLFEFPRSVIAVGGGLPCHNNQMELLLNMGDVIYLKTSVNVLVTRLNNNIDLRPLYSKLNQEEIIKKTEELIETRAREYNRADLVIHADCSLDEIVKQILQKLE